MARGAVLWDVPAPHCGPPKATIFPALLSPRAVTLLGCGRAVSGRISISAPSLEVLPPSPSRGKSSWDGQE